jgi:transposase
VRLAPEERKSNAGRKPFDAVMMFKILVLQTLYNLGDEQVEYQLRDRLSFMRFLRLGLEDVVPDATTVWLFREALSRANLVKGLFEKRRVALLRKIASRGSSHRPSDVPNGTR